MSTSMDDYMQTMQQQAKRRDAAKNIANQINATSLSNAAEQGAGENSAGLAANNPAQSETFVDARAQQAEAAQQVLAAQVTAILENAAAHRGPPGTEKATQAAAKQQVNALVKRFKEQEEAKAVMIAEIKYKKEVDNAANKVLQRLAAATTASTESINEDMQKSINDATEVYTTRPKDPAVNVVA